MTMFSNGLLSNLPQFVRARFQACAFYRIRPSLKSHTNLFPVAALNRVVFLRICSLLDLLLSQLFQARAF